MTSALDMPEIMSYIYSKSWKLQFSASSSIIIIEDYYLQTFLHSLKFAYKTGFSFTKRESRLQNEIFIYKERLLGYKRDSRSTFHLL